jgi:hypothetical protein
MLINSANETMLITSANKEVYEEVHKFISAAVDLFD